MARLSATLSRDFNISSDKAFVSLMNMGQAARSAGGNAALFVNQINEAASALRVLGANGEHAFNQVGNFQYGAMKGFQGAGLSARTAQQRAASGAANVSQTLGGMNMGMLGLMGEELGMGNGLDAWYAMASPLGRKNKDFEFQKSVQWMAQQAKQHGGTQGEQVAFLKLAMGTSTEGAEAILKANEEIAETGKLSHESMKALNRGFKDEAEKTSNIDRNIEIIKDGILKIGLGLLEMIVASLKILYSGLMWGMHSILASKLFGGDENEAKLADLYGAQTAAYVPAFKRGSGAVYEGAKQVGGAAKELFEAFFADPANEEQIKKIQDEISKSAHSPHSWKQIAGASLLSPAYAMKMIRDNYELDHKDPDNGVRGELKITQKGSRTGHRPQKKK
jgi:hypothetical protein